MRAALAALLAVALGALASCYSPNAQPGAPCMPALDNCPTPQTCALVGTSYQCVLGTPVDALVDGPHADAPLSPTLDALVDAPRADAEIDAAPTPTWSLVQSGAVQDDDDVLMLSPTGSGNMLIVAVQTNPGGVVAGIADDAAGSGNTYSAIPMTHATDTADSLAVELWIANASRPGATTLTITATNYHAAVAWEVSGLRASNPVDAVGVLDDQAATTSPVGPAITTAAAGEFIVSAAIVINNVSGIHPGNAFTNDQGAEGNGWGHLTNPRAPAGSYQAQWRASPAGGYCAVAAAFFTAP